MKSLFNLKSPITIDLTVFEKMKDTAVKLLSNTEIGQYTQAIVLFSATGHEYYTIIKNALSEEKTDETTLLQKLKCTKDTEICYALCMWQDNAIDIPSYTFRELLCILNSKNSDTTLFVMTTDGVSGTKLSSTMK